jgi:hypothetical protein
MMIVANDDTVVNGLLSREWDGKLSTRPFKTL